MRESGPRVVTPVAPPRGFATPVGQPNTAPKPAPAPQPLRGGPSEERVLTVRPPAAAQVSRRGDAPPDTQATPKTLQIGTIYFQDGSSRLSSQDVSIIQAVTQMFGQTGGQVRVVGHSSMGAATSDPTRREAVNFKMSLKRANAVANALIDMGIPAENVEVIAEGDRSPAYAETNQTGAAYNRRAEIFIDYLDRS